MTPTQKQLELKMVVTADATGGVRALQQLAAQAQQTQAAMQGGGRYTGGAYAPTPAPGPAGNRLSGMSTVPAFDRPIPVVIVGPRPLPVFGTGGGGGGGGGPDGSGGSGGGKEGGTSGMSLLKKAAVLAAAFKVADTAGAIGRVAHDSFQTNEQGARQLFREIVPFGGHIQSIADSVTGRQAAFERADLASAQRSAAMHGRTELAGMQLSLNPELAGHGARFAQLNAASPILEGNNDRSTALAERTYREKMRLLPLDREIAKSEREAATALAQQAATTGERVKLERTMSALQSKRVGLEKRLAQVGSGPERHDVLNRLTETESEIQATGGLAKQARMSEYHAQIQSAQKRYETGSLRVRRTQEEAGILEDQAQTTAAGAQRLGGMRGVQRSNAVRDLQYFLTYGREMLTDQQFANAQAIAPQTVAKELEKAGKNTSEFQTLKKLAPADYAGDLDDLRKKAAEKRDEAVKQQLDLDRELARASAAAGADLGKYLADVITKMVDSAQRELEKRLLQAKNRS